MQVAIPVGSAHLGCFGSQNTWWASGSRGADEMPQAVNRRERETPTIVENGASQTSLSPQNLVKGAALSQKLHGEVIVEQACAKRALSSASTLLWRGEQENRRLSRVAVFPIMCSRLHVCGVLPHTLSHRPSLDMCEVSFIICSL